MEKLRSGGARAARLRLGKECLRRLGGTELGRVRGGDVAEGGRLADPALVDDRRTMDLCPVAPFSWRGDD